MKKPSPELPLKIKRRMEMTRIARNIVEACTSLNQLLDELKSHWELEDIPDEERAISQNIVMIRMQIKEKDVPTNRNITIYVKYDPEKDKITFCLDIHEETPTHEISRQ